MQCAPPRGQCRYRELAEESRKKAAAAEDYILRRSYLGLADTYDKLAETLEKYPHRIRGDNSMHSPNERHPHHFRAT